MLTYGVFVCLWGDLCAWQDVKLKLLSSLADTFDTALPWIVSLPLCLRGRRQTVYEINFASNNAYSLSASHFRPFTGTLPWDFDPPAKFHVGKPGLGAKYTVQQNVIQKQLSTASADAHFWQKLVDERNRCPWLLTVLMIDMAKRWLKGTKCSSSDGYLEWSKNKNWRRQRIVLGVCNKRNKKLSNKNARSSALSNSTAS